MYNELEHNHEDYSPTQKFGEQQLELKKSFMHFNRLFLQETGW